MAREPKDQWKRCKKYSGPKRQCEQWGASASKKTKSGNAKKVCKTWTKGRKCEMFDYYVMKKKKGDRRWSIV